MRAKIEKLEFAIGLLRRDVKQPHERDVPLVDNLQPRHQTPRVRHLRSVNAHEVGRFEHLGGLPGEADHLLNRLVVVFQLLHEVNLLDVLPDVQVLDRLAAQDFLDLGIGDSAAQRALVTGLLLLDRNQFAHPALSDRHRDPGAYFHPVDVLQLGHLADNFLAAGEDDAIGLAVFHVLGQRRRRRGCDTRSDQQGHGQIESTSQHDRSSEEHVFLHIRFVPGLYTPLPRVGAIPAAEFVPRGF